MIRKVALVGMMGSGKSVVGAMVARSLGLPFVDLDEEIERSEGMTIGEIFALRGEPHFRGVEAAVLAEICRRGEGVLATGGGTVLREENRALLRRWGRTVYLRAEAGTLAARLAGTEVEGRPLLAGGRREDLLRAILDEREEAYGEADWTIQTDSLDPETVARTIEKCLTGQSQFE
jgi:shikimate kinase